MHPRLRYFGGAVIRYRMRRLAGQFLAHVADPRAAQLRVLRDLLALNAGSDFARQHGFGDIRTSADFRRRLPIADYEYFRPFVERVKQGELSALLGPRNRLLMFALTSGTT